MAKKSEMSKADIYREERKARLAKSAKKNQKKSRKIQLPKAAKAAIAIVLVLALIGGIGVYAYENSATKQQTIMAVKYMDTEISKPVFSYYYNSIFSRTFYYAQYYDNYGSGYGKMYTGYDYTISPDEQEYPYADEMVGVDKENPTWSDYFDYSARETIKQIETFCNLATEKNIELDDEHLAELDENMASLESNAESANSSVNSYLRTYYGNGVTKNLVKQIMEKQLLAAMYMESVQDGYKADYTDAEIEKYYKDNIDTYQIASIRYYAIAADKVDVETTAEDGTASTEQKVNDETMAAALSKANDFAAACKDDESFKKQAAAAYKKANPEGTDDYLNDDSKTLYDAQTKGELSSISEAALEWAFGAKKGQTYVEKNEDTGYTVYMVSVPAGKDTSNDMTYDVRHILIKFKEEETTEVTTEAETETTTEVADTTVAEGEETATTPEDTTAAETTTEATTAETTTAVGVTTLDTSAYGDTIIDLWADADSAKDKVAYKEAQDILVKYLEGDKSEQSFADLATKYSNDDQNGEGVADGGLYSDVPKGQMVPEFEDWCLDSARKTGDVGIIESSYGYHIMYFVKSTDNGVTWEYNVKNDMSEADFTEYSEDLLADEKYVVTDIDADAVAEVAKFNVDLAKKQIYSIQNQNQQSAAY